jgi:SAM-dependent methyltransferase
MSKAYELVRYSGMPFAQTHPDRLATMATLFGMKPPHIQNARVLEIGCCDGGNLIPMALSLPSAQFVGIDLTAVDIATARETAATLGLANVQFHAIDLTTLPGALGSFDYIVAHGVYSWIPPDVREQLLGVIQASLNPHGVAYVSYNTLPGGHLRMMMREMMLFHTRGVEDPSQVLTRARQLLEFISTASAKDPEYQSFVNQEIEAQLGRPDYGLFHDELEDNNHPVYFHDFAAHAARCGLQYLAEANYFDMRPESAGAADSPVWNEVADDPILREQYLDFARCRRFRQTLLCHQHIPLDRTIQAGRLASLYFASPARRVQSAPGPDSRADAAGAEEFHGPQKSKIKTAHPVVLSIVHQLVDAWPAAVPYSALSVGDAGSQTVFEILHALYSSGLIEIRTAPPHMTLVPGERPVASPLARLQASRGVPITTLRHTAIVTGGDVERRLISLLDGTRTRAALFAELAPLLITGKSEAELQIELETSLNTLGRLCLLTA